MIDSLKIGDIVRVDRYMVGRMAAGGPWRDETVEGERAIVIDARVEYGSTWEVTMRVLDRPYDAVPRLIHVHKYQDQDSSVTLLERGTGGPLIPGGHYALSELEERQGRWREFARRLLAIDWTYQGYSNPPTYLAALYLRQEPGFMALLPSLRRKDGTINPNKIAKQFRDRKLEIDGWAYNFPFDVPAEFAHYSLLFYRPKVDWAEVAADFAAEGLR